MYPYNMYMNTGRPTRYVGLLLQQQKNGFLLRFLIFNLIHFLLIYSTNYKQPKLQAPTAADCIHSPLLFSFSTFMLQ